MLQGNSLEFVCFKIVVILVYLHFLTVGMVSPLNFVLLAQMILPRIDPNFSQSKTLGSGLFSPSKALPHTEKLYAHSRLPSNGPPRMSKTPAVPYFGGGGGGGGIVFQG